VGTPGGADRSIVIECEITDEDLAAYASAVRRAPVGRRGFAAVTVLYELMLFFATAAFTRSWTIAVVVLPVGFVVGWFILPPLLQRRSRSRVSRRRSGARMPYRALVSMNETEISQHTDYGSSSRRWFAVEDVLESDAGLYVRTTPFTSVLIPRRAFSSDVAWRAAIDFARHQFLTAVRPDGL
jgi:hypothetical protein